MNLYSCESNEWWKMPYAHIHSHTHEHRGCVYVLFFYCSRLTLLYIYIYAYVYSQVRYLYISVLWYINIYNICYRHSAGRKKLLEETTFPQSFLFKTPFSIWKGNYAYYIYVYIYNIYYYVELELDHRACFSSFPIHSASLFLFASIQ